jgi:hypothetical protein
MDPIVIGIDVSKDKLDVHVLPMEQAFAVPRTGAGIEELAARLAALEPKVVAIEATGGFETIVAAGLAGAGLPLVVVNPAQIRAYAKATNRRAKTGSTPPSSPTSPAPPGPRSGRCRTRRRGSSPISSQGAARSSR